MKMRFVDHSASVEPKALHMTECDRPQFSAHEVLLKVHAFGVNRADTLQRQGRYPEPPGESPILGLEVSGEIVACGADVSKWKVGDRVCGLVAGGGYAEYVALDEHLAMAIPAGVSMTDAAGLPEVFLTAYQALFSIGQLQRQQTVLIHAGASGVGLAAIQLARLFDCDVAVTASSQGKLSVCAQLGAHHLINYQEADFAQVLKGHNWRANVIVDFVGGDYLNRNLNVLAQDGHIIYLAMLAGRYADKLDMAKFLAKRANLHGSTLRNRDLCYKRELVRAFQATVGDAFASETLQVNVDSVLGVEQIGLAHQRLESNQTSGKIIVTW